LSRRGDITLQKLCNDLWYIVMIAVIRNINLMIVHDFTFEVDTVVMGNKTAISM
jgi:hypothetical protein